MPLSPSGSGVHIIRFKNVDHTLRIVMAACLQDLGGERRGQGRGAAIHTAVGGGVREGEGLIMDRTVRETVSMEKHSREQNASDQC